MDRIGWLERRSVLMHIAERRRGDVRMLLRNKRYDGAVYLVGYVVECMLKAAICQWIGEERLPERYMTHDLNWLREQAVITMESHLRKQWQNVEIWNVTVRYYSQVISAQSARQFIDAMEVIRKWLLEVMQQRERR